MANLVDRINEKHMKPNVPEFRVGDTIRVDVWVKEGKKERIQAFEGIVIAKKGSGVSETFSVRKKSGSVGVVRVFPINAPTIDKITVVKKGLVRRAKLNFIKNMRKEYKVKERNSSVKEAKFYRTVRILLNILKIIKIIGRTFFKIRIQFVWNSEWVEVFF